VAADDTAVAPRLTSPRRSWPGVARVPAGALGAAGSAAAQRIQGLLIRTPSRRGGLLRRAVTSAALAAVAALAIAVLALAS